MKSATILIMVEHAPVRTLLVQVLEGAGYQVYEAATGRQGLARFHAQSVDLVLADLEMPEMNGLEVTLEFTRAFLDAKVIAMSGRCPDKRQQAKLLGARQTLPRPLDIRAMLQAVQYELQH